MNCRDLIIYILENNLLEEPVFKDSTFVGFVTDGDAAEKLKIGPASLKLMLDIYDVEHVNINGTIFIPYDFAKKMPHIRKGKEK